MLFSAITLQVQADFCSSAATTKSIMLMFYDAVRRVDCRVE